MALKKIPGVASAVFSTIAAVLWMEWLKASDAYYIPYLVTAGVSLYCVGRNHLLPPCLTVWQKFCLLLGSSAFSLAVVLANYAYLASAGQTALYFLCGVCIGWQIFSCLLTCCERPSRLVRPERPRRKGWQVWLLFAAGISAVYLFVFFTCKYPGIFTYDTAQQLAQIQSGVYSNHHPFYHTQIIRLFLTVGMALFGEGNQAAALYCVFQVLTIAAVFSYVLTTLYQQKINRGGVLLVLAWYTLMPFHVLFSFTVWKDVLWSGCVTLFITALYRVFFRVGRNLRLNHVWMGLGAVGFCLLRSNGWFAFAILTVVFCLLFFRQYPRVALTLLCVLAVTWFLKNPVLNWLGVTPPDTIEHLSIPAQQIAYVLGVSGTITEEDRALLSQIIDLEKAGEAYLPYLSDPIKNLVREKGNQHLLTENKMEYLMLWLRTGLNNPRSYLYAWIEQTRGYYNAGHHYWIWSNETYENAWQISRQVASQPIAAAWENYSKAFRYSSLCIFVSVGFHMWLAAGSFVLCAARKRWREAFLSLPVLTILLSLLVATPVAYEFRYIYALFTSLPLLLFLPGCSHEREEQTAR